MPRSYRDIEEEEEASRQSSELPAPAPSLSFNNEESSKAEDDAILANGSTGDTNNKPARSREPLTPEETIQLARRAVENGIQETKRSLAGSEAVGDVVKPKLTIDLGHSNISHIPEPVVDAIKDEVERCVATNELARLSALNMQLTMSQTVALEQSTGPYTISLCRVLSPPLPQHQIKQFSRISKRSMSGLASFRLCSDCL